MPSECYPLQDPNKLYPGSWLYPLDYNTQSTCLGYLGKGLNNQGFVDHHLVELSFLINSILLGLQVHQTQVN